MRFSKLWNGKTNFCFIVVFLFHSFLVLTVEQLEIYLIKSFHFTNSLATFLKYKKEQRRHSTVSGFCVALFKNYFYKFSIITLFYLSSLLTSFFLTTSLPVIKEKLFYLTASLDFYVYVYPCCLTA